MNNKYEIRIKKNKLRRKRQLRRRILFTLSTTFAVIILSIILFGIKANAEGKDADHVYKYFKSVLVSSDDTLWDYAKSYSNSCNYQAYVNEVININHLDGEFIESGMNLIIPYYSEEFVQ